MTDEQLEKRIAHLESDNARLRSLLDSRDMPADLRHKARNTLARVRAIIHRSALTARTLEIFAAHLEERFDAILRAQNVVTIGHSEGVDLHALISDELHRYSAAEGEQAWLSGPKILLRPRAAEILGLAFHELAINALEHGALRHNDGKIIVDWKVEAFAAQQKLAFHWREVDLPTCRAPTSKGFGFEVLQNMLPYELDAETRLEFEATGLSCTIELPFGPEAGVVQNELDEIAD